MACNSHSSSCEAISANFSSFFNSPASCLMPSKSYLKFPALMSSFILLMNSTLKQSLKTCPSRITPKNKISPTESTTCFDLEIDVDQPPVELLLDVVREVG